MSAYDNPAIIKNDSALIWAESMNKFGENFNKSLAASKERQAAEEKELRLTAEKNAKDAKEQAINNQVFQSKLEYDAQVRADKIDEKLGKAGATPGGVDMAHNFVTSTSSVVGRYDYENATMVVSKEKRDKASTYKVQQAKGEANLVSTAASIYTQTQALKTNEINATNINEYRFRGTTSTEQVLNRMTAFALTYEDGKKSTKNITYDVNGDPSDIDFTVNTSVANRDELIKIYEDTNPALKNNPATVNAEIDEAIKNKDITESGSGYTLNFKRKVGAGWDGNFYDKIPKIEVGVTPVKAGVYAKENDTDIAGNYLLKTEYVDAAGNAGLSIAEGTAKYQRTAVNFDAIRAAMRPTIDAKAAGMVAVDMSNPNIANGVLANLDLGTNFPAKEFAKLTTSEKVKKIADELEKKEEANIIAISKLTKVNGVYYKGNPEDLKMFGGTLKAQNKAGNGKVTATNAKQLALNKKIIDVIEKKRGSVPVGSYTFGILDGRWSVYDNKGVPKPGTENITDPSVLATYIGGTID